MSFVEWGNMCDPRARKLCQHKKIYSNGLWKIMFLCFKCHPTCWTTSRLQTRHSPASSPDMPRAPDEKVTWTSLLKYFCSHTVYYKIQPILSQTRIYKRNWLIWQERTMRVKMQKIYCRMIRDFVRAAWDEVHAVILSLGFNPIRILKERIWL